MRILAVVILLSLLLFLFSFYSSIKRFSEEIFLPDQNPELIHYLQGDWANANDERSIMRIKRDSIIVIHNDSIISANNLYYQFNELASAYYTKDSAFAFSPPSENSLKSENFKLREVGKNSNDTAVHILVYVSRLRVDMISGGKPVRYNRVN